MIKILGYGLAPVARKLLTVCGSMWIYKINAHCALGGLSSLLKSRVLILRVRSLHLALFHNLFLIVPLECKNCEYIGIGFHMDKT